MDIKIILASSIFRAFICKFACWLTISSEQALNFFQVLGANKIDNGLLWIEVEGFLECLPLFLCSEATREVSVYVFFGGGGSGKEQRSAKHNEKSFQVCQGSPKGSPLSNDTMPV